LRQIGALASAHRQHSCGYGHAPRDVRDHVQVPHAAPGLPSWIISSAALPAMREELPVINAHPGSIAAVLEEIAKKGRAFLAAAGVRARAYVQRWHDPASVAAALLADYRTALGRP